MFTIIENFSKSLISKETNNDLKLQTTTKLSANLVREENSTCLQLLYLLLNYSINIYTWIYIQIRKNLVVVLTLTVEWVTFCLVLSGEDYRAIVTFQLQQLAWGLTKDKLVIINIFTYLCHHIMFLYEHLSSTIHAISWCNWWRNRMYV